MYVKITNGSVDQYPYTVGLLRRDNPNVSFPKSVSNQTLKDWDVYPVTEDAKPSFTERTQKIQQNTTPTLVDDVWKLGWTVIDKTTEEVEEYDLAITVANKTRRNDILAATDWWGVSDNTMSDAQATYRQALRDLPSHSNWPNLESGDWPTEP